MIYKSLKEICEMAAEGGIPFWKVIQRDDCTERNVSEEESFEQMRGMYQAMIHADEAYTGTRKSNSGMVGGDGKRLETYVAEGKAMSGPFVGKVNDVYRRVLYLKHTDYHSLTEMKDKLEQYIEMNSGFDKLRIQFDFNPMNIF